MGLARRMHRPLSFVTAVPDDAGQVYEMSSLPHNNNSETPTSNGHAASAPGRNVTLFVIEDNPADVFLIQEALGDYAKTVNTIVAEDGLEAVSLLKSSISPDLILLDLNLPKLDGLSVLAANGRPEVPVVVFSSSRDPREVQRALKLGARDFVLKPSDLDGFIQTIQSIVTRFCFAEKAPA